jgi:hypothetical protein
MFDYQEERLRRGAARRSEVHGDEDQLLERAVGDSRSPSAPAGRSVLRRQHERNVVWRWHTRRRQSKP